MSRRNRTLEILAAAKLAPSELALERERTRRGVETQNRTLSALSSLIPAGASLASTLSDNDLQQKEMGRKLENDAYDRERDAKGDALKDLEMKARKDQAEAARIREERRAQDAEARRSEAARLAKAKADAEAKEAAKARGLSAARANLDPLTSVEDLDQQATTMGITRQELLANIAALDTKDENAQRKADLEAESAEVGIDKGRAAIDKMNRAPKGPSPDQKRLRDARLRKAEADAISAEKRNNPTEASRGKMLPPGEVNALALERNNLKSLQDIREKKKGLNTGGIAGRLQSGTANFADNAKWAEFQTSVQVANKLLARAVEGGRMTDADAAFYQRILANPNLDDDSFNAVIDFMEGMAKATLTGKAQALQEAGYAVPQSFLASAPTASSTPVAVDEAGMDELFSD